MKKVFAKLINLSPLLVVIVVAAYVAEELIEDYYTESLSDLVYPVAFLIIFGLLWYSLAPLLQEYLAVSEKEKSDADSLQQK